MDSKNAASRDQDEDFEKLDASPTLEKRDSSPAPLHALDNRKRHVLTQKTKLSAIFTVIFSGIALCSDGYQAGIIGNIGLLFVQIFPKTVYTPAVRTRLTNSFFVGEIVGMLAFGAFIDRIGRKTGVVLTTGFLILGVILCAAAHGTSTEGLLWMLIVARGIAGVGAGGEYPVCGTSSIEAADETQHVRKNRGFLVAVVGDMAIAFGSAFSGVMVLIVLAAYGYSEGSNSTKGFNGIWRVCFAVGIVPPLSVLYFRIKMFNSTAFRNHAMKNGQLTLKVYGLIFRRYWRRIIGTCLCWFLYDFTIYPFGLFSSTIISQVNPSNTLIQNVGWGTVINSFSLPGCVIGGLLMDRIGRRNTQFTGFFIQGIIGMIIGGALSRIQTKTAAFIVLYGLFHASAEVGPGVATILISGEVFPTPIRGTMFGFAAAWGKAGAAIGTQVFTPIQEAFDDEFKGRQAVFLIGSAVSLLGAIATYFLIPDMSRELENEDEAWRAYLEANGVSTSNMGELLEESASSKVTADVKALGI